MTTSQIRKFGKNFITLKPTRIAGTSPVLSVLISIGIVVTQIGDFLSTKIGLTSVGATEANSIMSQFIAEYGWNSFLYLKLIASVFLIWSAWKRPVFGTAIVTLYLLVILNNLVAILAHLS